MNHRDSVWFAFMLAACGTEAREVPLAEAPAADRAAIQRLIETDQRAVVAGDAAVLKSLWTDDIVSLAADGNVREGRAANERFLDEQMRASAGIKPVRYTLTFPDTRVIGPVAYQWGSYQGAATSVANGDTLRFGGKVMRVLRQGADGEWRVARTMFTAQ
jgi:uncharacterized protein (TIGR02246 family)